MPWTTGNVSTFTNKFINTAETIGTGDGVDTTWSYTVSKPTIFISGVKLSYVIGGVTYTPTSDASGNFSGTGLTSGSVTEAGLITLVFSTAPDNTTLIRVTEYTTKGLLQKLREFIATNQYEETIGTGDGVDTTFSATLANTTIAKGQVRVKFKIAGVVYWVWDNGSGSFIHAQITTGTIDYNTGDIDLEFVAPIDNTYAIKALYTTGAVGQDWLIMHEDISQDNVLADAFPGLLLKEYVFRNSGANWAENVVLGLRESQYVPANQYIMELNLYSQWAETEDAANSWNINAFSTTYDATREHWSAHPSSAFNDATMTYWIKATKNYLFLEAKVSGTVYTGFYGGNGIRFCSQQDYPNPNIILGNSAGNFSFSSTATTHTMLIDPASANSAWLINQENELINWGDFRVLPPNEYVVAGDLEKTSNSKVALNELFAFQFDPLPQELLFQIRDLYHTPYINMNSEDTLGGGVYRVFQNIFRTSTSDYFAIKEAD